MTEKEPRCVFNEAAGDILLNMSSVVTKRREHMLAYRKTTQYKCKKCSQIHTRHHFIWAKPERA